jgi:hypothetical protein
MRIHLCDTCMAKEAHAPMQRLCYHLRRGRCLQSSGPMTARHNRPGNSANKPCCCTRSLTTCTAVCVPKQQQCLPRLRQTSPADTQTPQPQTPTRSHRVHTGMRCTADTQAQPMSLDPAPHVSQALQRSKCGTLSPPSHHHDWHASRASRHWTSSNTASTTA